MSAGGRYTSRTSEREEFTNLLNTIGYLDLGEREEFATYTPMTAVSTNYLLEWARLCRYYQPTAREPVQVGVLDTEYGPGVPLLAARRPDDSHLIMVAPRTDGGV